MPTKSLEQYSETERKIMTDFGNRVRRIRIEKGLSQEKLAELTDVHRTYISGIERGRQNISLLTMNNLAQALSTSIASLITDART
ncbi:helix-turn-helix domain-containing protein [Desulfovibrio gilichinskyi]|uniref:DNA-binding transcriptional regulator, XRE-family HTH domain n=1 Tax=Desulfovibrio gilichinskyi TaxID=1519643 RepID=A0A1X7EVP9_9BACT|nr:helix-turn-helix transcriptional regulator [Desulfovibrio gilichinskyi]SMF41146.1 DNA-binding transcriptional regulator, XRE-family HTH domain [Desulfovibrio gilichinskyi]